MCDERKNPMADIEPHVSRIVAARKGMLAIGAPK
jgi:hypothetical protein